MPASRKAAKKGAHVDRYGQRSKGEAEAEDASVHSVGEEEIEVDEVEPLLDGGELHEAPPKEWTLADGSPVFRAGKKSLRLEPRLNRNGHGEDSSDLDLAHGEYDEADVDFADPDPALVVPVRNPLPPISVATPRGGRGRHSPRAAHQSANGSPRARTKAVAPIAAVVVKPTETTTSPLMLLLLLLATVIGAAIMFFLFSAYHPAVILATTDLKNGTLVNPVIANSPSVVEAHKKIEILRDETNKEMASVRHQLQEIDGKLVQLGVDLRKELAKSDADLKLDIIKDYNSKHEGLVAKLQAERTELLKDMEALKRSMDEKLAKKLDVSEFEKRFKLDEVKNVLSNAIEALAARIKVMEERPTVVAPANPIDVSATPIPIPNADLAVLRTQLIELKDKQDKLAHTVTDLQSAEKKLNDLISKQLTSPAAHSQIINIINNYLASGSNTDLAKSINKLATEAVTHNKEFTTVLKDLAAVAARSSALENSVSQITKDVSQVKEAQGVLGKDIHDLRNRAPAAAPSTTGTAPSIDLTPILDRIKKLEETMKIIPSVTPDVKNEMASVRALAEDARNEAASAKNEIVAADARRISDKESLQERLVDLEKKINSAAHPSTTQSPNAPSSTSSVSPEVIRSMIIEEVTKRVNSAASTAVGQPDHALWTTGARVLHGATGYPKDVTWATVGAGGSSVSGNGGLLSFLGLFSKTPSRNVPSIALDPVMTPGHCWPFPGHRANYSVNVPCAVAPTAFTIDHIPASEALNPNAMPRNFNVYGWRANDTQSARTKLVSNAEYQHNGPTAQTFPVDKLALSGAEYDAFTLEITSNYGDTYTCLYRFRVHGRRSEKCANSASAAGSHPSEE